MFTQGKIRTDKFRVSGTAPITNKKGSTNLMRAAISTLVNFNSKEELNLGALQGEFEDALQLATTIEVNGTSLWDQKKENLLPQASNSLNKAKETYKNFDSFVQPSEVVLLLQGFHVNAPLYFKSTIIENYKFNNKTYDFQFEGPPSPLSRLELKRTNKIFTYTLHSPATGLIDGTKFYIVSSNGTLEKVEDFSKASEILCEITVIAKLDLTDPLKTEATYEITVSSKHPGFNYCGSSWSPEIIQLENINRELEKIEDLAAKVNLQIGIMIERIKSTQDFTVLFSSILHLFNQTMRIVLLRDKITNNNKKEEADLSNNFGNDLKKLISTTLEKEKSLDLLELTEHELTSIFQKLNDIEIADLFKIFYGKFISQIRESALFVSKNPELCIEKWGHIIDQLSLNCTARVILEAIDKIKFSLQKIKEKKKIEILGFKEPKAIQVTDPENVSSFFQQYLMNAFQNNLENHPIRDLFIGPEFLSAIEKSSKKGKQEELNLKKSTEIIINIDKSNGKEPEDGMVIQLLRAKIPSSKKTLKCCADSEKIAALLAKSPFIESLNEGLAIEAAVRQILMLYPTAELTVKPYLSLLGIGGGAIGGTIGRDAILNPNKIPATSVRIWKAGTNGFVMLVFALGSAINIYLFFHPTDKYVSNKTFWSQIASTPLGLAAAHTVWNAIGPHTKAQWFPEKTRSHYIKVGLDLTAKTFFFSGILDITLLNFFNVPGNLVFQFVPTIPAFLLSLGSLTPYKERINWGMVHLISANFTFLLIRNLSSEINRKHEDNPAKIGLGLTITEAAFWGGSLLFWTGFLIKNSIAFIKKYRGDPEFIIRTVPERLYLPDADDTMVISQQQHKSLKDLTSINPSEKKDDTAESSPLITNMYDKISKRASYSHSSFEVPQKKKEGWKLRCGIM